MRSAAAMTASPRPWPTGLSVIEATVLGALAELGVTSATVHTKSAALLAHVADHHGVAPRQAYDVLCLGSQRHVSHLPLFDGHGNVGRHPDQPPANPRYTEVRPSAIGQLAVEHRARTRTDLPIGLINGDVHLDGNRPAFDPVRVLDAVEAAVRMPTVPDTELDDIVGPPVFPSGCAVDGDVEALVAGASADLVCGAHIESVAARHGPQLTIRALPPGGSPHGTVAALAARASDPARRQRVPELDEQMVAIRDLRTDELDDAVIVDLRADADLTAELAKIRAVWGVTTTVSAHLPAPLAALVRQHATGEPAVVLAALARLRSEIDVRTDPRE